MDKENKPRVLFSPEAPEILFEDYGTAELVNGEVYVPIDEILKESLYIDDKHPLKVFIQLEGDCNGVFVTEKSKNGFKVKELANGTSNTKFSWHIVANRADDKDAQGNIIDVVATYPEDFSRQMLYYAKKHSHLPHYSTP